MSIKTILAPLTGAVSDRPVLDAALALATSQSGAHIQAQFLHRDPQDIMVPHMGHHMSAGLVESLIESANEQIKQARHAASNAYTAWRETAGVGEAGGAVPASGIISAYAESIGDVYTGMSRAGKLADAICMVRTGGDAAFDEETMIHSALMETGKPLLLVPAGNAMGPVKSIAIAWNGSRESARAVALAMPLLEAATSVSVLAGTGGDMSADDVSAFSESLVWHGINASVKDFALSGSDLTECLQVEAEQVGADLLVMGAYSHSRLREFVLGGVTDDLIKGARVPVFMSH